MSRRTVLTWLGLTAIVLLGLGGGYLAASRAKGDDQAPAATAAHGHGGHVMPDGTSMSGSEAMPAPSSTDMSGMDMSGGDMRGMDMSGQNGGHSSDGHRADTDTPPSRPRAAVLGTFGLVNGGVLLTAFTLRRRGTRRQRGPSAR